MPTSLALHVRVDSRDVAPLAGEGLSGAMIEEMMSATEKESNDRAHAVRSMFERFVTRHDVVVQEAHPGSDHASASFAAVTGREEDIVAQQARLADLTVVPHPDAGEDVSSSDALHAVLFDSGRPVLISPQVSRRGSARASASPGTARPNRRRRCRRRCRGCSAPKAVAILSAEGYQRRGPGAPDLAAYLALHEIHAEIVTFRSVGGSVGAGLLAAAADFGCDLLSMGAYSHSRLRQLILGGVTRHVLEHAKLPVMMNR